MLTKTIQDAINAQIQHELYSAYLYLAMSAHFEAANLVGFAKWTRAQAEEEQTHAMKFFDFINDRGGRVMLKAIDQPPTEYGTPLEVFEEILKHEQKVTGLIYKIYEAALKENDYPTQVMLQWFINEQVEEEKNAGLIVDQLKMLGASAGSLYNYDRHVGRREEG
jgi:ferritin